MYRCRQNEPVDRYGGPRVKISLDHFDRAGSPLCAYYVFIMVDYREPAWQNHISHIAAPSCRFPVGRLPAFIESFGSLIDTAILAGRSWWSPCA